MGVGPERSVGMRLRDRATSRRVVRDDGTSDTGIFDCVLQPVRDITGMLWICAI
jgi:hypothetical protein